MNGFEQLIYKSWTYSILALYEIPDYLLGQLCSLQVVSVIELILRKGLEQILTKVKLCVVKSDLTLLLFISQAHDHQ